MADASLEDLLDELLSSDEEEISSEQQLWSQHDVADKGSAAGAQVGNGSLHLEYTVESEQRREAADYLTDGTVAGHSDAIASELPTVCANFEPGFEASSTVETRREDSTAQQLEYSEQGRAETFEAAPENPTADGHGAAQQTRIGQKSSGAQVPVAAHGAVPSSLPADEPIAAQQAAQQPPGLESLQQAVPTAESRASSHVAHQAAAEDALDTLSTSSLDLTDEAAFLVADVADALNISSSERLQTAELLSSDIAKADADARRQEAAPKLPHVAALDMAEAVERDLATGRGISGLEGTPDDPTDLVDSLRLRLQWSREEWDAEGLPDSRGGLIGGQLLVRADLLGPLDESLQNHRAVGEPRAVAVFRTVVAVGTSSGICVVLMPRALGPDGAAKGQAEIVQLGQAHATEEAAVTCLTFSPHGNLLAVGHANGDLVFWEFRRMAWESVKTLKDAHVNPIVQATFLEGSQITAVTADSRGRLMFHNVTAYLSLTSIFTGLTKAAQPSLLTDGRQLGPLCVLAGLPAPKTQGPPPTDAGRPHFIQDGAGQHVWDGMLVMCSAKGAFIGKVSPEGRLGVLHSIPRPPDAPEGCLPYAAWRLLPLEPAARYARAHLVLGWGRQLFFTEVPIPLLPPAGEASSVEKPPLRLLHQGQVERSVSAVHWLDGPALTVITQSGPHAHLSMYSAKGEVRREYMALGEPLLPQSDIIGQHGTAEACHHNSSAVSGGGIILLGSQGVRLARLMTWQERLSSLRGIGQWELALLVGLDVLQTAKSAADGALAAVHLWRGEGKGAEPHQVADTLAKLLDGYLAAALPRPEDGSHAVAEMQAAAAADIAVELCMALDMQPLLWSSVFPRFAAAGCRQVLLEHLLPHIFRDQLTTLAPEVMQALVEHCAREDRPEAVEAAVMHMDIASLDLNQVVRLCRQHHLYSALAFLFPRALLDFVAPAAELVVAVAYASDEPSTAAGDPDSLAAWSERRQLAFKLLVYLRTCFQGLSFPPGSGMLDPGQVSDTRAHLLGFLLYGTPQFMERLLQAFGADESVGSAAALEELLPGPHPVLRCLASVDAGCTLLVLREALLSCSLTDAALREAVHAPPGASDEVLAEQAVLDAVVSLLDAGGFRQAGQAGVQASTSRDVSSMDHALEFISETVAEGRVTAAATVIMKLLQWLALGPWRGGKAPPLDQRERQFMALLQHLELRRPNARSAGLEATRAQALAQQAGFHAAEARVHHLARNYAAALRCFLQTSAAAAFEYLDATLGSPSATAAETDSIWGAVQSALPELVGADSLVLARLVLARFPDKHSGVIYSLQGSPELQFRYLRGAMQAGQEVEGEKQGLRLLPPAALKGSLGAAGSLQAEAQASELYVRLLCQFEPAAVLPFLQNHEAYRVQEVLPYCQQFGVLEAQAYLLERLGDIPAALDIYVQQLEQAARALVDAVLSDRVPAAQLQAAGHPRASHSRLLGQQQAAPSNLDLPPEVTAATAALKPAVALCQRHSRDASPEVTQQLWLNILQGYVTLLRELRTHPNAKPLQQPEAKRAPSTPKALAWPSGSDGKDYLASLKAAAAAAHRQEEASEELTPVSALQQLLMRFTEDIIADMAGYVPLSIIGGRILEEFASDQFGDFKGSLVGLLAAYNYELSILQAANRLMSSDAFRLLYAVYRNHSRSPPVKPVRKAVQESIGSDLSQGASSSTTSPIQQPISAPNPAAKPSEQRISSLGYTNSSLNATAPQPGGGLEEPQSPLHRSGFDINFLRAHGLRSMNAFE